MRFDNDQTRHVFSDKDAEVIHQALMLLLAAIEDLKEVIVSREGLRPSSSRDA